jgi:hypothetical protein
MQRVVTQPAFEEFRQAELHVPLSRPKSAKGFPFQFELGRRMVHEGIKRIINGGQGV